jgi:hypothetical protein
MRRYPPLLGLLAALGASHATPVASGEHGTSTALLSLGMCANAVPPKMTGLGKTASLLATWFLMVQKAPRRGANWGPIASCDPM